MQKPEVLIGENGLLKQLTKLLVEKALDAELSEHLGHDRHGGFEPQLIPKHQTRWSGFEDKIISLYARGMTVREIQAHLQEMYGTEVSPSLISSVTDAVSDEVKAWQARPLDAIYPIVYLDCIHVKVRECALWSRLPPFFDYPPETRKVIYTTNAIESVNMGLRKLTKNRGSFPSDEALTKVVLSGPAQH